MLPHYKYGVQGALAPVPGERLNNVNNAVTMTCLLFLEHLFMFCLITIDHHHTISKNTRSLIIHDSI